jgi:hypothetical protein
MTAQLQLARPLGRNLINSRAVLAHRGVGRGRGSGRRRTGGGLH